MIMHLKYDPLPNHLCIEHRNDDRRLLNSRSGHTQFPNPKINRVDPATNVSDSRFCSGHQSHNSHKSTTSSRSGGSARSWESPQSDGGSGLSVSLMSSTVGISVSTLSAGDATIDPLFVMAASAVAASRPPLIPKRQISHFLLPPSILPSPPPSPSLVPSQVAASSSSTTNNQRPTRASTSRASSTASSSSLIHSLARSTSLSPSPSRSSSLVSHLSQHRSHQQQRRTMFDLGNKPSEDEIPSIILETRAAASGIPGEEVEPRQTLPTEDMEPNPANSIKLPPNRQRLVEDVIALYSNGATIERVARYAPGELQRRAEWSRNAGHHGS